MSAAPSDTPPSLPSPRRRPRAVTAAGVDITAFQDAQDEAGILEEPASAHRGRCPIYHPDGVVRKRWDIVQVFALLYVALLVPFRTGFGIDLEPFHFEWWLELVVDLYFIADIALNFRTSFDDDGVQVLRPGAIAKSYLKGWLAIDVVSCLPVSYITQAYQASHAEETAAGSGANVKVFKILRLLRLAKLLRLGRLKKLIKRHEEEVESLMGVMKVMTAVLIMIYVCHIIGCFWYWVGEDEELPDGELLRGWISREREMLYGGVNMTRGTYYIAAYYWAITTISTVGFGDIVAKTRAERFYTILAEGVGTLMFAILIGSLGSMMVGRKLLEEKVDKQLSELREFLHVKRIPKPLRGKVRRYMEVLYEHKSGFDEKEVLSQLPPAISQELLHCMYRPIIKEVPMFSNVEEGAVTRLCMLVKPYSAMKGDLIYTIGEVGREIFIIIEGFVSISFNHDVVSGTGDIEQTLSKGHTFGEGCLSELFEMSHRKKEDAGVHEVYKRKEAAFANTACDLKFLTLADLSELCTDFDTVRMEMWALNSVFQSRRAVAVKKSFTKSSTHQLPVTTSTVDIAMKMSSKLTGKIHKPKRSPTLEAVLSAKPQGLAATDNARSSEPIIEKVADGPLITGDEGAVSTPPLLPGAMPALRRTPEGIGSKGSTFAQRTALQASTGLLGGVEAGESRPAEILEIMEVKRTVNRLESKMEKMGTRLISIENMLSTLTGAEAGDLNASSSGGPPPPASPPVVEP